MRLFHGPCKVHDWKQHKHKGLNKTHQYAQKENRQRGQGKTGKTEEDAQDLLFSEYVPEEPDAQGHDAGKMTYQLDDQHQRGKGPYGP